MLTGVCALSCLVWFTLIAVMGLLVGWLTMGWNLCDHTFLCVPAAAPLQLVVRAVL
jgi:hypothetical protein